MHTIQVQSFHFTYKCQFFYSQYVDQNSDWPEHVSGTDTLLLERPVSPKHASSDDDIKLKDCKYN